MDNEGKDAIGIIESIDASTEHLHGRVAGKVTGPGPKSFRAPRQHHDLDAQFQFVVGPQQTLEEPSADEAGASCEEDRSSS
jgi:hypothetical protein